MRQGTEEGSQARSDKEERAVNPSDVAIIAIAVVSLAHVVADYRVRIRVADRLRLVNPPKQQEKPDAESDAAKGRDPGPIPLGRAV